MFGTQLVAAALPWSNGLSVPVGLPVTVVVTALMVEVGWAEPVGEEPVVMGPMVPVQALPSAQQAGWPPLSMEHTSVVRQQRPGWLMLLHAR